MRSAIVRGVIVTAAAVLVAQAAHAASAARAGDRTSHGGTVLAPASPSVFIQGLPAARVEDSVACPLFNGPVPHVGGPIVSGSRTVFVNGRPAAFTGSVVSETGTTSVLTSGSETVRIETSPDLTGDV